jgi:ubiquitin carboxyl-terminal hydrolase 9/24
MSYRRQKRWWNAYILIYERMEELDTMEQKEMTLTRSMQDLSINNKTSQVKMPASIERCVRKQNILYMHYKNQFCLEYFQFMLRLLTCNAQYVHPLQGQDKLTHDAEELASLSVQLGAKFLFDVGFHTKKTLRGPANEWYDALCIHLRHSKTVRNWFAQNMLFSHQSTFAEYLLECPSSEVGFSSAIILE